MLRKELIFRIGLIASGSICLKKHAEQYTRSFDKEISETFNLIIGLIKLHFCLQD